MNKLFILLISGILLSCSRTPSEVKAVLEQAGENRPELEKVIRHYRQTGEKEKLKASYFLIQNMQYHFSYDGEAVRKFDKIFDILDSLYKKNIKVNYTDDLQIKWDSLVKIYGTPQLSNAEVIPDIQKIKAEFLIENIDWAFKMRDSTSWGKKISFDDFCNYILPYRLGTERLEKWRPYLYKKIQKQRDTTTAQNRAEYASVINTMMDRYVASNKIFWSYPFDMKLSDAEKGRLGACKHQVHYTTLMMRANGLPVGMDFVPRWANKSNGHEWNVLLMEDGKFYPFDAASPSFSVEYDEDRFIAKVFRKTFAPYLDEIPLPVSEDLPPEFYDFNRRDVTMEYKKVFDIKIPLSYPPVEKKEYALICTFDNQNWSPQYFGKIRWSRATFKRMGVGNVYMAMYYENGSSIPASDPFLLDTLGRILSLEPNEIHKQDMVLYRKYPLTNFMKGMMKWTQNCKFQGANDEQFNKPVPLYQVDQLPLKFETGYIKVDNSCRYVRFVSDKKKEERGAHLAEIEFYGLGENGKDTIKLNGNIISSFDQSPLDKSKLINLFDSSLLTYFQFPNYKAAWVGLDLGKPYKIVKVKYCPRNDVNFIEAGHTYELCFWKKGEWVSMGKQVAIDQVITFKNIPSKALYVLHDLTAGKEERIFTYENGKQLFW